jgi:excisionase family DNA binding protein
MTTVRQKLATPQEVADYLNVPLNTVYDWRRKRTGPKASKVGVHLRYRWSDVETWLNQQAQQGAA